jgi:ubiquinone biosynthesis O-methyltransferase
MSSRSSIDTTEVNKFTATSDEWWGDSNSSGSSVGPLHKMNPVRCQFIRRWTDVHYAKHDSLEGLQILDVGCGGGLLSETLARAGAHVTGIDASAASISAAKHHYATLESDQELQQLMTGSVQYRDDVQSVEELLSKVGPNQYDVVCALEVVEHVPRQQQAKFIHDCRSLVKDDGCMFVSTLNRTARSLALAIFGAEMILKMVPSGTHDWGKFVTVDEMRNHVRSNQGKKEQSTELMPWSLQIASGMQFHPLQNMWFENELDTEVNYITYSARENRK